MTYSLTIDNDWGFPILAGDDANTAIAPGQSFTFPPVLGTIYFTGSGIDTITVLDIGTDHIGGDSGEANGVLITFRGINVVGRYDDTGALTVTINKYGQVSLDGLDFRAVSLRPLTFNQTARKKVRSGPAARKKPAVRPARKQVRRPAR